MAIRRSRKADDKGKKIVWTSNGYTAKFIFYDWGFTGKVTFNGQKNRYVPEIYEPQSSRVIDSKKERCFTLSVPSFGTLYGKEIDLYTKAVNSAAKAIKVFQKKFDAFIEKYK